MTAAAAADALVLAEAVAREAGALLRDAFAEGERLRLRTASKSSPTDLVSEADLEAERLIRERLVAARPDDAILGEEGDDRPGTSGRRWIVDPLDGTVNFLFGIPEWTVSVACEDGEGTMAGVVYDPLREEAWAATREGAPTLNGLALSARPERDLAGALVATGFGYDPEVRAVQAELIARLLPRVRDIRRIGSAAQDLAWAAAGRYDAYFERGVKRWDVAAGELICARAGLAVRPLTALPPSEAGLLVAPPALVDELAVLLV